MTLRYPLIVLLLAGAALAPHGPAAQDASQYRPGPLVPRIKAIETTMVSDLTGSAAPCDQRRADVRGTDLGIMAEVGDRLFFLFGDTFGYDGTGYRGPGGSNWRSNAFGSAPVKDPREGICIQDWRCGPDRKAIPIVEGAHQPAFTGTDGEQTKIPTGMVAVGGRLYVEYMSIHGFASKGGVWQTNYTRWMYSDDLGKTWTQNPQSFGDPDSAFTEVALAAEPGKGNDESRYVYALGTPSGRFGPARCARVPKERVLDIDAWEYYAGGLGSPEWSRRRAEAVPVVPPPVGEGSILWDPYLQRWLYTYLNEATHNLELREAEVPWGPWSPAATLATAQSYPQLYGAFMTPSFLRDGGETLFFVMSTYYPYGTHVMKAALHTD